MILQNLLLILFFLGACWLVSDALIHDKRLGWVWAIFGFVIAFICGFALIAINIK